MKFSVAIPGVFKELIAEFCLSRAIFEIPPRGFAVREIMPDILITSVQHTSGGTPVEIFTRLAVALLLGFVVAGIYKATRKSSGSSFPATLVLLSVLIAMVTQVIGDNVARAFSLVGALSIVRFRTVVRDTQDTAYASSSPSSSEWPWAREISGLPQVGSPSSAARPPSCACAKSWPSARTSFSPSRPLSARHRRISRHILPGLP